MSVYEKLSRSTVGNLLIEATNIGDFDLICKVLEDMKPDETSKKKGLSIALKDNKYEICKVLLDNIDEDINIKFDGISLLKYAVMSGNAELVRLLIRNGIDVKNNSDALYECLKNSDTTILKLLLENGANVKDNYPWLFNDAYKDKNFDAIKLLLENGANPGIHDDINLWYKVCETLRKLKKEFDEKEIFDIIYEPGDTDYNLLHIIIDE